DGQRVGCIKFDNYTMPHFLFALGVDHEMRVEDPDIVEPLNATRANNLRRYDSVYGPGNWTLVWLVAPKSNEEWRHALDLFRRRQTPAERSGVAFSNEALASLLGAIFAPAVAPHTTH
ncbi:MAG: hypothetical protein RXS25_42040, partial [Paraburkholderia sp.]